MTDRLVADLQLRSGRAQNIGLGLIGFALIASLIGLTGFPQGTPGAWWAYLASLLAIVVGCYLLFNPPPGQSRLSPFTRSTLLGGGLILVIAIFVRFYKLDSLPTGTWIDEAENGLSAIQIVNDANYRPVFIDVNNPPAHLFYLLALFQILFGPTTLAFRLLIATFGVGATLLAFFVGREAHGNRFGLLFAFLIAVGHWPITMSRIGLHGMTTPFFILLTLYFLFRAKRTRRVSDFLLAGLTTGLGLSFYTAYRTFLPVIALFLAYWAFSEWRSRSNAMSRPAIAVNLVAFAVAGALAVAPVAQFAILDPETFWARANKMSIFNKRDEPDLTRAILSNSAKHLLMFNYQGDRNGRHNFPNAPMLDEATGALFVLGIGLALSRPRNAGRALFLLLLPFGLLGGILSVDFEAPQSLRSIAVLPAAFYFAALAGETLWRGIQARFGGVPALALALLIGGYILYANAELYFVRQPENLTVWEDHNGIESTMAQRISELGPEYKLYGSMYTNQHKVIQFLAPQAQESQSLIPPNVLPLREPGDQPAAMLLEPNLSWIVGQALRYYPNAKIVEDKSPPGDTFVYTVTIPAEDIANTHGVTARYWPGETATGEPALTRTEKTIAADWPPPELAAPFVAEWSGMLYAPNYGVYEFTLQSPAQAAVWIDEQLLLEGTGQQQATLKMAQGDHALRVQANSGPGALQLQWTAPEVENLTAAGVIGSEWLYLSPPTTNNGLRGAYYSNDAWLGEPAFERVDPFLDMYFHIWPLVRPYTVDWVGKIEAPWDGQYAFGLRINGTAQVFIDDQLILDTGPIDYVENTIPLTAGRHNVRVHYLDNLSQSRIHLYWTPPGQEREIIPSTALLPYP